MELIKKTTKFSLFSLTLFMLFSCDVRSRVELSELKIGATLDSSIIKNTAKQIDLDQTTGLPYYSTYKNVESYRLGSIKFSLDYPKEKPYLKSEIGFLVNNQQDNVLQGYFISTYSCEESKSIQQILKQKYANPIVVREATDTWPYSAYYWKGTTDGLDILLAPTKQEFNYEGKEYNCSSTSLYMIKSGLRIANMDYRETVLFNFIKRSE
ncbi:hypothetical protein C9426_28605 [Serratia sp. S1B]|nr:hypothetical protein C9426_28605 [Serratia sp. S1B]